MRHLRLTLGVALLVAAAGWWLARIDARPDLHRLDLVWAYPFDAAGVVLVAVLARTLAGPLGRPAGGAS